MEQRQSKISYVVFDLDDTLLDTTNILWPIKNTPQFLNRIQSPLPLIAGALTNLQLSQNHAILHLVTQGNVEYQKMKIDSLGISHFFNHIDLVNTKLGETKRNVFKKITEHFPSSEVLSIGNRISTDLSPAIEFGCSAIWFKYGEHAQDNSNLSSSLSIANNHHELHALLLQIWKK